MTGVRAWLLAFAIGLSAVVAAIGYWGVQHSGPPNPYAIERLGPLDGRGDQRPNVILVLLDTTRADHLGPHGQLPDPTPFLTELARQGVVFDRAFSVSSWTAPATASVFTGQYPWTHGIVDGFQWHQRQMEKAKAKGEPVVAINRFGDDTRTLPEHFRDLGYATVGLASNINIGDEIGFDRGFDRFVRERANVLDGVPGMLGAAAERIEDVVVSSLGVSGFRRPIGTARDFRARLGQWEHELEAAQPYFLYLHLNDSHMPYVRRYPFFREPFEADDDDPRQQRREDRRADYLSELGYIDHELAKVFDMGFVDDNTLFVVVSDHGEEFGDHGRSGHSHGLHAELNRIVMIVHGPGLGIGPARIADVNVSQIDLLPTLLELVGAPVPQSVQGRSLAPILRRDASSGSLREDLSRRVLFAHRRSGREWLAAIEGPWKLIRTDGQRYELFDLSRDPHEHDDLASRDPAQARRLKATLEPLDDPSTWRESGVSTLEATDALQEQLRALGYVE